MTQGPPVLALIHGLAISPRPCLDSTHMAESLTSCATPVSSPTAELAGKEIGDANRRWDAGQAGAGDRAGGQVQGCQVPGPGSGRRGGQDALPVGGRPGVQVALS